jgi:hypothetical protein
VEDIDRKQLVEDIDRKKHNKEEEYGESNMEAVFNKNFSDDEEVKIVAPDNMSVLSWSRVNEIKCISKLITLFLVITMCY